MDNQRAKTLSFDYKAPVHKIMNMNDDGGVNYDNYNEAALLEVFHNMRSAKYPINFKRVCVRLESLGYQIVSTPQSDQLVAPPDAAARLKVLNEHTTRPRLARPEKRRTAWILFVVAFLLLVHGIYGMEAEFEFMAIASMLVNGVAAILIGSFGVVFYWEAYREQSSHWVKLLLKLVCGAILCFLVAIAVLVTYHYVEIWIGI